MSELTPGTVVAAIHRLGAARGYAVAFSGGPDSHALLHATAAARDQLGAPLRAIHVDHRLHPDSAVWASHCARQCQSLGIPLTQLRAAQPPPARAGETWAREIRYTLFAEALASDEMLLTAHHRDDQAETVLLRLLRGAGPEGLAGIPPVRALGSGQVGRPLLDVPRAALTEYAQEHALPVIADPGNADCRADRNFIRHRVLPLLEQRWPAARRAMAGSGILVRAERPLVAAYTRSLLQQLQVGDALDVAGVAELSTTARRHVVREWLHGQGLTPPGEARLNRGLEALLGAGGDRRPELEWPKGRVRRHRGWLYAEPGADAAIAAVEGQLWDFGEDLRLPHGWLRLTAAAGGLDPAMLPGGVTIRFRRDGDRCRPVGRPTRPLKKLFQEAAIPPWQRYRWPLLCDSGVIVAVPGICVCDGYSIGTEGRGWWPEWQPDGT